MRDILSRDEWLAISTACGEQALKDVPCAVDIDSSESKYRAWFVTHQTRYAQLLESAVVEAEMLETRRKAARTRTTYSALVG